MLLGFICSRLLHPRAEVCRLAGRAGETVSVRLLTDNRQEWSRACTYASKEPETLEWLRRHTKAGEVLWDVGANVGLYSLYAARLGLKVWAFEPHLPNAAKLLRNVEANGLTHTVKVVPICLLDGERFGGFFVSSFEPGTSIHAFRDGQTGGTASIVFPNCTVLAQYGHHAFGTTGDKLAMTWGLPEPHHIKIDVDGRDMDVLAGMDWLLHDSHLRTLLIEVHDDHLEWLRSFMAPYGFREDTDYPETSREREKRRAAEEGGRWSGSGNVIFVRQA